MVSKKEIAEKIALPKKTEEKLRSMKILTSFKKNAVEFIYKNWRLIAETDNEDAEEWLYEKLKSINAQNASATQTIYNTFSWFDSAEGAEYWREKLYEAGGLKY